MPRKSNPNWQRRSPGHSRRCRARASAAGLMKKTSGTAAKRKRSAASANGGTSRRPTLIGTNEKPNRVTTASVSSRSRGARRFFRQDPGEKSRDAHANSITRRVCSDSRSASAMRVASVASCKRQRRRAIVEHRVDEMRRLVQERLLEALVERRRAFVAHAVRVGDVDAVQPRIRGRRPAGRRCRRSRSPSRGRAPSCARRRSRPCLPSANSQVATPLSTSPNSRKPSCIATVPVGEHAQRPADCPEASAPDRCRAPCSRGRCRRWSARSARRIPTDRSCRGSASAPGTARPIAPAWILS